MSGFTGGDWTIYEKTHVMSGNRLIANTGGYSFNVDSGKVLRENEANARLLVVAPKMYEAHETIVCLAEYYLLSGGTVEELMEQLRTIFNTALAAVELVDKERK